MTYQVQNNRAYINGLTGYYDKYITNPAVRYARNSAKNNKDYVNSYSSYKDELPPIDFEYRYMPIKRSGIINADALMGASFEEMGSKAFIKADAISQPLKENAACEIAKKGVNENSLVQQLANVSDSRVIDLNNDGYIDLAEYGTTILAADMMSKSNIYNLNNITGTINSTGCNKALNLMNINNANNTRMFLQSIYNTYNLGQAQTQFLSNPNNTINIKG